MNELSLLEKFRMILLLLVICIVSWTIYTIDSIQHQLAYSSIQLERVNMELARERDEHIRVSDKFHETVLHLQVEVEELDKSTHQVKNAIDALDRSVDHLDEVQHEGKIR